jgi:hypothetical protein
MTRIRFATARDVLDAFPQIRVAMSCDFDDTPSIAYLDTLVEDRRFAEGVTFLAHLLPRRESVWWAAKSVRAVPAALRPYEEELIATAENWVREPDEETRLAALSLGASGDTSRAATWVTRAAAWSGGAIIETGAGKVMSEPFMTPAAVRGAILIASGSSSDRMAFLRGCIDWGRTLLTQSAG